MAPRVASQRFVYEQLHVQLHFIFLSTFASLYCILRDSIEGLTQISRRSERVNSGPRPFRAFLGDIRTTSTFAQAEVWKHVLFKRRHTSYSFTIIRPMNNCRTDHVHHSQQIQNYIHLSW